MAAVAPSVRGGVQVVYGNNNWATTVQGVTPDYMTIRDYTMLSGLFFTDQDVDAAAKVAVLGETVVQKLFGNSIGRGDRNPHRFGGFGADLALRAMVDPGQPVVDPDGVCVFGAGGRVLWLLSSAQGGVPGPD